MRLGIWLDTSYEMEYLNPFSNPLDQTDSGLLKEG
jgi:hypothetical protein